MKILHIITGLNIGGAEMSLKRLILSHQSSSDFNHSVISLTNIGPIGNQLIAEGIVVIALNMKSPFSLPKTLWRLRRIIRQIKPDIVQTWMYHADLIGGIAAKLAGIKAIIWGIRNCGVASTKRATAIIRGLCVPLSYFIPSTIVCVADTAKKSHSKIGYCVNKMQVINNGFELKSLSATSEQRNLIRQLCGVKDQQLVIGMVGRFHPIKDHLNFIKAAHLVCQQFGNVHFILVGKGCDNHNIQLLNWLTQYDLVDKFSLLSQRNDVAACLSAMDIFCSSSLLEGFPNAVGEAMAMERPCVVTQAGDSALLVGDYGIVVPVQDAKALADGLIKMLNKPKEQRLLMAKQGKQRIIEHFALSQTVTLYEKLYYSLRPGSINQIKV